MRYRLYSHFLGWGGEFGDLLVANTRHVDFVGFLCLTSCGVAVPGSSLPN